MNNLEKEEREWRENLYIHLHSIAHAINQVLSKPGKEINALHAQQIGEAAEFLWRNTIEKQQNEYRRKFCCSPYLGESYAYYYATAPELIKILDADVRFAKWYKGRARKKIDTLVKNLRRISENPTQTVSDAGTFSLEMAHLFFEKLAQETIPAPDLP